VTMVTGSVDSHPSRLDFWLLGDMIGPRDQRTLGVSSAVVQTSRRPRAAPRGTQWTERLIDPPLRPRSNQTGRG
jgi:hypothetical protein